MSLQHCAACSTPYAAGLAACPNCQSADRVEELATMLPTIEVACDQDWCRAAGQVQAVRLQPAGTGFVVWPDLRCASCGCQPPLVRSWRFPAQMGDNMAKITAHGGPSDATVNPPTPESPSTRVDPGDPLSPMPEPAPVAEPASEPEPEPADVEPDSPADEPAVVDEPAPTRKTRRATKAQQ